MIYKQKLRRWTKWIWVLRNKGTEIYKELRRQTKLIWVLRKAVEKTQARYISNKGCWKRKWQM